MSKTKLSFIPPSLMHGAPLPPSSLPFIKLAQEVGRLKWEDTNHVFLLFTTLNANATCLAQTVTTRNEVDITTATTAAQ